MGRIRRGGKRVRAGGGRTRNEDCCCCIEGNEPTAGFYYEQTGESPCTINLYDESTIHANCTDGTIVEWKWYKNEETTPFSTDQNPTGVEVEDGDDIRLWVKDSCGCTDEVVMAIECVDITPATCAGHNFILPPTMTANFPNVTNTGGCLTCDGKGGSRTLLLLGPPGASGTVCHVPGGCCAFTYGLTPSGGLTQIWALNFFVPVNGTSDILVTAVLTTECGGAIEWRSATIPWQSNFTSFAASLPYFSGTQCNGVVGTNVSVSA